MQSFFWWESPRVLCLGQVAFECKNKKKEKAEEDAEHWLHDQEINKNIYSHHKVSPLTFKSNSNHSIAL